MKTDKKLTQTIEYLHADIATLNEKLNASEDGSGITKAREDLAKAEEKLFELQVEHQATLEQLGKALEQNYELAKLVPPSLDPEPESEPEPETHETEPPPASDEE